MTEEQESEKIKEIQEEILNSNENSIDKNQKFENWKRIKVKDLNFTYPDNTKALENINLEIIIHRKPVMYLIFHVLKYYICN